MPKMSLNAADYFATKTRVCFVTETGRSERPILDPSVRYRCFHPAEALTSYGLMASVYSAKQFYMAPNSEYDVYVFHRPNVARLNFTRTIKFLADAGKILIADYDDLIFGDDACALDSSAVKNGTLTPAHAINAFRSNLSALDYFNRFMTSTQPLKRQVLLHRPDAVVQVVPNHLPTALVDLHMKLGTVSRSRYSGNIGYFAGTKSHNLDFPRLAPALSRALSEDPQLYFTVVGPVEIPGSIASLQNVRQMGPLSYNRLPSLMAGFSTVVAPLESSLFNECKSRVKYLEACLAGCHLIASPIPDMKELSGGNVAFADSDDEWYERIISARPHSDSNIEFLDRLNRHNGSEQFLETFLALAS